MRAAPPPRAANESPRFVPRSEPLGVPVWALECLNAAMLSGMASMFRRPQVGPQGGGFRLLLSGGRPDGLSVRPANYDDNHDHGTRKGNLAKIEALSSLLRFRHAATRG